MLRSPSDFLLEALNIFGTTLNQMHLCLFNTKQSSKKLDKLDCELFIERALLNV